MNSDDRDCHTLLLDSAPAAAVRAAAEALRRGGVVVFPTDTVYGLLAGIEQGAAYHRIYELKRRPATEPLALLIAREGALAQAATTHLKPFPTESEHFAQGQLTLILGPQLLPSGILPNAIQRIQPGDVGLRCPAYEPLQQLLEAVGGMLWATSANTSGSPPATTAAEVREWLANLAQPVDLAILTDQPLAGQPSAVVRLAEGKLEAVRE